MRLRERLLKFGAVGVANTLIDLGLYTLLRVNGMGLLPANAISTTAGLTFSLAANHTYAFRDRAVSWRRTVPLFVGTTVVGLWALQPLVISAAQHWLPLVDGSARTVAAKLCGIGANVVWNFVAYDRVVFAERRGGTAPEQQD